MYNNPVSIFNDICIVMEILPLQKKYIMRPNLLFLLLAFSMLIKPTFSFSQAPSLGNAGTFVLFSSNGAVTNDGASILTGNVGTNLGPVTGFGNVNGTMHAPDAFTQQAAADLLLAYNQLNNAIPTRFLAPLLGNGQELTPAVYSLGVQVTTLDGILTLNGQGNANAVFIIQIGAAFSTNANAEVRLINNAQACNVFWKVEGKVDMATNTTMKGTIIANNAEIVMAVNDKLEGRALSTTGAVTTHGVISAMPIGCGSPILTGPIAPNLGTIECFAIFTGSGFNTNSGVTHVKGNIGTNVGITSGYDNANVNGTLYPNPSTNTAQAVSDLNGVRTYLNTLPVDIELLYPAQFGNNLELTPHTYLLTGATVLTNNLYLNAENNPSAVFVIKIIGGALSTSTFANVILLNGAQAENVYWLVDGATAIDGFSEFKGTIVGYNGALDLAGGVVLQGRALTTSGALTVNSVNVAIPTECSTLANTTFDQNNSNNSVVFYPNPFSTSLNIVIQGASQTAEAEVTVYDLLGRIMINSVITKEVSSIATENFPSGMYFYIITSNNKTIQSGKLIAQ